MAGDKIVITKDDIGSAPPSGKGGGGAVPPGGKSFGSISGAPGGSGAPQPARGSWTSNIVILLAVAVVLAGLIAASAGVVAAERACQPAPGMAPPTGPASWCLVIDRSGSMLGDKIVDAKDAAKDFVAALKPDDEICVVDFSSDINVTVPLQLAGGPTNPQGTAPILAAISGIQARGSTALWDAGDTGVRLLAGGDPARKRIMILLSDGQDNTSHSSADELIAAAKQNNIVIHTVALGYDADRSVLSRVAKGTGGSDQFAKTSKQLRGIYQSLGRKKKP